MSFEQVQGCDNVLLDIEEVTGSSYAIKPENIPKLEAIVTEMIACNLKDATKFPKPDRFYREQKKKNGFDFAPKI